MRYTFTEQTKSVAIADDDDLYFSAPFGNFVGPVAISGCRIRELDCLAAYFNSGLRLVNSTIDCPAMFQSSGHNKQPVEFVDVTFLDNVDFEDCCFDADVVFKRVRFARGTNILGNKATPVAVTFEGELMLTDVEGALGLNTFEAVGS